MNPESNKRSPLSQESFAKNRRYALQESISEEVNIIFENLFHMQVGHGLKHYRKYLLEKFSNDKEMGSMIWDWIITAVELWERGRPTQENQPPSAAKYPKALERALKVYG